MPKKQQGPPQGLVPHRVSANFSAISRLVASTFVGATGDGIAMVKRMAEGMGVRAVLTRLREMCLCTVNAPRVLDLLFGAGMGDARLADTYALLTDSCVGLEADIAILYGDDVPAEDALIDIAMRFLQLDALATVCNQGDSSAEATLEHFRTGLPFPPFDADKISMAVIVQVYSTETAAGAAANVASSTATFKQASLRATNACISVDAAAVFGSKLTINANIVGVPLAAVFAPGLGDSAEDAKLVTACTGALSGALASLAEAKIACAAATADSTVDAKLEATVQFKDAINQLCKVAGLVLQSGLAREPSSASGGEDDMEM